VELKRLIVEVKLAPGVLLSERDLMERLGIGRTPVREAMQRLTKDHLVESVPHHGYFVAEVTFADLGHAFEVRVPIECLAARLAAQRVARAEVDQMRALITEVRAGLDTDDIRWHMDVDRRFHELVAAATGNPYLYQTIEELFNLTARLLYMARRPIPLAREEIDNYELVVAAIERGDPDGAEAAMREHIGTSPYLSAAGFDGGTR
jgi:DNA-binding GntR family transcriptional regulator